MPSKELLKIFQRLIIKLEIKSRTLCNYIASFINRSKMAFKGCFIDPPPNISEAGKIKLHFESF